MELSSHEGDIPIPINTTFGGGHGHMIHHDHHPHNHINISSSSAPQIIPNSNNGTSSIATDQDHHHVVVPSSSSSYNKKTVRYKECLKNHAASMGGNATDGCGEFMPSGEEGSIEALTCSACNCHRNFHRKEVEGEQPSSCMDCYGPHFNNRGRKLILSGHHHKGILAPPEALGYPIPSRAVAGGGGGPHHGIIMSSYNNNNNNMGSIPSESDEQEDIGGGGGGGGGGGVLMMASRPAHQYHHHHLVKKRHRTKFTQEQKEKMLNFAEKVGWKIQKQEEAVVQQLCQEIGVKRRVLKVWMHNNKHNLAKKLNNHTSTTTATTT